MSKYDNLTNYLRSVEEERWDTTFDEIEAVLEFKLPESARRYPAWWANQSTGPRVQCSSWMRVGWHAADLDLEGGRVSFVRADGKFNEDEMNVEKNQPAQGQSLAEAVHAAKTTISEIAGVSTENVRISIDY